MTTNYIITGRVLSSDRKGVSGLTIMAWDKDLLANDFLGSAKTDKTGAFTISFDTSMFKELLDKRPDIFFKIYRKKTLIHSTENEVIVNAGDDTVVHITLPKAEASTSAEGKVSGKLTTVEGEAVAATIQVYNVGLQGQTLLTSTKTTSEGTYTTTYRCDDAKPDIQIKASRGSKQLAMSRVHYDVTGDLVVNLVIKDKSQASRSEYQKVHEALSPLITDDLKTPNVDQLAYLAGKTGYQENQITSYLKANEQHKSTKLDRSFFYALNKKGLVSDPKELAQQPDRVLRKAIEGAVKEGEISEDMLGNLDRHVGALYDYASKVHLEQEGDDTLIGNAIKASSLNQNQRKKMLKVLHQKAGTSGDMWKEISEESGLNEALVSEVKSTMELSHISANNLSMTKAMKKMADTSDDNVRSLAKLDAKDWEGLITKNKIAVPSSIEGETPKEKRANYAQSITNKFERHYAGERVTAKLIEKNTNNDVGKFLKTRNDFDIARTSVHDYIKENKGKLEKEVDNLESLSQDLKKNQRLYKLAPSENRSDVMDKLDNEGLSSAVGITNGKTQGAFVEEYSDALGGPASAAAVYENASAVTTQVQQVVGTLVATAPNNSPAVVTETVHANSNAIDIPDLEALFGSQSYCECQHCRSVLSPAAYMVDLLEFLRTSPGETPLNLLMDRRPDLGNIELSCENTNTALPYIDLVIEILENAVLLHNGESIDLTYQSTGTTQELQAFPENTNTAAYDILNESVYPFILPFHFSNAEGDAYIKKLDTSRFDIMKTLEFNGGANEPTDLDRALANLGLSTNQKKLIVGDLEIEGTTYTVKELWGESTSTWKSKLAKVDYFLDRTGLTYQELQQLLQVEFINPDGDIIIDFSASDDPCDISQALIRKEDGTSLNQQFFQKTHRFLRLHQKLNWGILELGYTMKALNNTLLKQPFLERLSMVKDLQERTEIDLIELLGWWSDLSTAKDESEENSRSYYETLFLNKAISNPIEADFELNGDGTALAIEDAGTEISIYVHATHIAAALGISSIDLSYYLGSLASEELTLANLSQLHRLNSASEALDIKPKYLLKLFNLIEEDPFTAAQPDGALAFVEKIAQIKSGGLDEKELAYLLMHDYDESDKVGLTEESIGQSLTSLQESLQKVSSENDYSSDPTGELTLVKLALITDEDGYNDLVAIIAEQSTLSTTEQEQLIEDYLVFLDTTEAITNLLSIDTSETQEARIQARYNYLFEPLLGYVVEIQSSEQVAQHISDEFELDLDTSLLLVSELAKSAVDTSKFALEEFLDEAFSNYEYAEGEVISYDLFSAQYDTWLLLHKAAMALTATSLTNDELIWVYENTIAIDWLDLNNLPTSSVLEAYEATTKWLRMSEMCTLNSKTRTEETSALSLLDMAVNGSEYDIPPVLEDFADGFQELSGWELTDISFLLNGSAYDLSLEDCGDGEVLVQLETCLQLAELVKTSTETLWSWAASDLDDATAASIRQTAKSHYGTKQWLTIAPSLRDPLRQQQRDALSAYLTGQAGYEDEMDLFDHYLIDTEMEACMLTSRIKQANSSLQLFIQRSFMGLEEGVTLDTDQKQLWEWMAQYRIWEANRMVFLFPENWLEPELRSSKSEFFEALESELLQDQINVENVERAITRYIEKVDSVSWLEILGTYHVDDEDTDVLHVIGRTKAHPHIYYYRKQEKGNWTPWEKLDLEMDSEFAMPIVINGRLLLFWAKFRETVMEATRLYNQDPGVFDPLLELWGYDTDDEKTDYLESISDPFVYYDINIGVSEYKYDKWTPGRMSKESFQVGNGAFTVLAYFAGDMNKIDLSAFRFYVDDSGNTAKINCYFKSSGYIGTAKVDTDVSVEEIRYDLSTGTFTFEGSEKLDEYALPDTYLLYNKYKLSYGRDFVLYKDAAKNTVTVLDTTKDTEIPIHAQYPKYYSQDSLFFQDPYRIFFVTPKETVRAFSSQRSSTNSKSKSEPGKSDFDEAGYDSVITQMKYKFENFYHPYSNNLIKTLNLYDVSEVMKRDTQLWEEEHFDSYGPLAVVSPYPKKEIDFTYGSSYGIYNWELFYHVPMLIANQLNQDQQFEEAQQWYHYIFNPLDRTGDEYDTPQHFWQFKPFFEEYELDSINDLMFALSYSGTDSAMLDKKEQTEAQIEAWKEDPFEPHTIAALRQVAYMKNTVLKYIDNLIDWGDSLFKRDTIESINEATQLYILAYKLMGERPEEVPTDDQEVYTYNDLKEKGIDAFSNALIEIESLVISGEETESTSTESAITSLYHLYFCIPHNKHLIKYWDRIEDRLFKIRNCMNIDGITRSLALFEPAIDPGMLVNAKAAGIDLGSVLSDLNAPLPNYRFQFYISKAKEYARDIQGLGSALLSALEKKDAEALVLLRSNQELSLQASIKELKKLYVQEARENLSALEQSKVTVEKRYKYYRDITKINAGESAEMVLVGIAGVLQAVGQGVKLGAAATTIIPDPETGVLGIVPLATLKIPGGEKIGRSLDKVGDAIQIGGTISSTAASIVGKQASYQRRWNDWKLQEKLAKSEIKQIDKQIAASEVRVSLMEKELTNFEEQMEQSVEYHEFMTGKYTNKELYQWMISQLSSLYFQAYKLAYDCAKRAQKNFQYELNSDQIFVQYGYWNSLKKGLLAGEKLQHDLKRMEMAYFEQNKRGLEISKNVSIGLLDPMAMVMLKQTGSCYISLPESVFDLDYPGHYLRRIKSVSLTIPCVAGPYTSVSCTLTLMENSIRTENNLDEESLVSYSGATQSMATSNAQQDSGMFQLNFNDERYLPFEGAGAISQWKLQLPTTFQSFDYNTITDVILRVNYLAKDGGETFRSEVNGELETTIQAMAMGSGNTGLTRMFSTKHDFANDWYRFLNPTEGENHSMNMEIAQERFPFMFNDNEIDIRQMDFYLITEGADPGFSVTHDSTTGGTNLSSVTGMDGVLANTVYVDPDASSLSNMTGTTGTWTLEAEAFDTSEVTDLIIICHYGI